MAIVQRKVSDLSGQEAGEGEFTAVVVRQHPAIDHPKTLDVLTEEVELFKPLGDLVMLEVQQSNGTKKDIVMKRADFDKLHDNMAEVLRLARGTKGRVPGTRLSNGA